MSNRGNRRNSAETILRSLPRAVIIRLNPGQADNRPGWAHTVGVLQQSHGDNKQAAVYWHRTTYKMYVFDAGDWLQGWRERKRQVSVARIVQYRN